MRLRTRLVVGFIVAGLVPFSVLGVYAYFVARHALSVQAENYLVAVREIKRAELADYFDHMLQHMRGIRTDPAYGEALEQFGRALTQGRDSEAYRSALAEHGTFVRQEQQLYDFYDVWLIDEDGQVVFSATTPGDIGSRVQQEPLEDSGLARTVRRAGDDIVFTDFSWYPPAGRPLAYFGVPLRTGVAVVGLGAEVVNRVVARRAGLGRTGEVLVAGPDYTLRSGSAIEQGAPTGAAPSRTRIESEAVSRALEGASGVGVVVDYAGDRVESAYAPLQVYGENWALVVKKDLEEVLEPVARMRALVGWGALLVGVLVAVGGWLLARGVTRPLEQAVSEIASTSREMSVTAEQHEKTAGQQSAAVSETASTMNELSASARRSAEQTESASAISDEGAERAAEGDALVQEMLAAMDEIRARTDDIGEQMLGLTEQTSQIQEITAAVTDLSNQINLLSLNAAVEAVRAGEHGKGFGVVAQEIRKLADQSKRSAGRIATLLQEIQGVTNRTVMATEEGTKTAAAGTEAVNKAGDAFRALAQAVAEIAENTKQVALSAREEAEAVKQANEAMNTIDLGIRDMTAGARQTRLGVETLNQVAERLRRLI